MSCYKCGEEGEDIKFYRGSEIRVVHVCQEHRDQVIGLPWNETSGLAFTESNVQAQIPSNQNISPFQWHSPPSPNVPTPESTGGQLQNATANLFPPYQPLISGAAILPYEDYDLFAYVSGGNVTVVNPLTNAIVVSGTDVTATLQSGINYLQSQQGQTMHINRGLYVISGGLFIPGHTALVGTPASQAGGGSQLRTASGVSQPCIIVSGVNNVVIRDISMTYNFSGYSSSLLYITGSCAGTRVSNVNFYDFTFLSLSGVAIQIDNGGIANGPSLNNFDNITVDGFNTVVRTVVSGGSSPFVEGNNFTNCIWTDIGQYAFQFISSTDGTCNYNIYTNLQIEPLNNIVSAFDYATQASGTAFGNVHMGVVVYSAWSSGGVYATVRFGNELTLVGCTSDWLMSGDTTTVRHYSLGTNDRGKNGITSSGVGTNSWFIPFNYSHWNSAPSIVKVQANNSGTASAGTPFVSNITISGFTVNSPTAVNSGVALSWAWNMML